MVAMRVETDPTFAPGPTSVLFSARAYLTLPVHRQFDVSPDGKRFLMIRRVGVGTESLLILVQNFFEELRARVHD